MATAKLLAFCALPMALVAQDQAPTVTLDEAIRLALRNQPAVIQARGDVSVAAAGRREAVGNWLPSLSVSSSMSTSSSERFDPATQLTVSGSSTSASAGLSAGLELFDGFRRFAQTRAANAGQASADAALVTQEFQVTLQTKQAFFNALAGEELVRVSETRIRRADEQLKVARDKLAAGSATRSDTLRSTVELGNARLQLLNAQTQRANAIASLSRLIGVDGPVTPVPDESLYALEPFDRGALETELLGAAPTVLAAEAAREAAQAQVAVTRAQYMPSLSASYSRSFAGSDFGSLNPSWNARLSLSWSLFNGFTRETSVARVHASRDAAEARVADTRRQAAAQLTQFVNLLEAARARIDIGVASTAAGQEDLRVQNERYRLGAATIVEVLASQLALDEAEVALVQARLDFLVAKAQLEALLGRAL
jgi:outer membrane protein TolC